MSASKNALVIFAVKLAGSEVKNDCDKDEETEVENLLMCFLVFL